jgi:DNA-binding transcriptional MerR regulator
LSTVTEERRYRIGGLAERAGVTARTIRYYEELGLLGKGERTKGAQRLYSESDVARLQELIRLRDLLGLTLDELVELADAEEARAALRGQWADSATDDERAEIVDAAISIAERQLELVHARKQRLAQFADELTEKLGSMHERKAELDERRGGT